MGKCYSDCVVLDLAGIIIRVPRVRRDIWLSLGMIAGVSPFSWIDLILSLLRSINSMAATRSTSLSSSQGFSHHYPQHFMVNHA
jgi:hypothetical protein